MWSKKQKYLVHLYARAAALPDADYRALLRDVTGSSSSAERRLDQRAFDQAMARFEGVLEYRIAEGLASQPATTSIPDLRHWRDRLSTSDATTRKSWEVRVLWERLLPFLHDSQRSDSYLLAIASKACGMQLSSPWSLADWQASRLIDALRDRLSYASSAGAHSIQS